MSITVGSNIASLRAQRSLSESSSKLSSTYERLSSGLRINRASDDAAGLSIASTLQANSRIYAQGIRNLSDGISLIAIADGAVEQLTTIVTRLKELAEQASNGTFGAAQRKSLDNEAQALSDEFFRISKSTKFNGRSLFDGSVDSLRIQAGFGIEGGIASGIGGAIGAGTYNSNTTRSHGVANTGDITSADFNGDGFLDTAMVTSTGTGAVVFGDGKGGFTGSSNFTVATNASKMVASDFNSDGILDLAVGQVSENTVSILLGNGDGTFKARQTVSGTQPFGVQAGDVNGDGKIDLLSVSYSGDVVNVFLGNGNGAFAAATTVTVGTSPEDLLLGDFNGDGILDIASSDYGSSAVGILLGRGDGTFKTRVAYATALDPERIDSGDFNGDGVLDLAIAGVGGAESSDVLIGNGDGTFKAAVAVGSNAYRDLEIADINGDGLDDLLGVSGLGGFVTYISNGDGTFSNRTAYTNTSTNENITVGDFNGDGVPDALTSQTYLRLFAADTLDGVAPLIPFSLKYQHEARQALSLFSQRLDFLGRHRGEIGAFQSRVNVAISTLITARENFEAAAARITDADVASESSELTRIKILQQTATAVLGQANIQPQLALSLLSEKN